MLKFINAPHLKSEMEREREEAVMEHNSQKDDGNTREGWEKVRKRESENGRRGEDNRHISIWHGTH